MTQISESTTKQRTVKDLVENIDKLTEEIQNLYSSTNVPFVVGYSGGKDSSTVVQLIWNAIAQLPAEKRFKKIHIITTDTLVENPIISTWVRSCLLQMQLAAEKQNLPIETHLLYPETKNTFWSNLIGKGYPAPRQGFRWCTERLKISPSNNFIRKMIRASGEVILVLGTRKQESSARAATMAKHELGEINEKFNVESKLQNSLRSSGSLPNALIYSPIEDWQTEEVWMYLMQWDNPWGGDNKDLFHLYRGATADNECPLVVDTSTPSCGDSRFGCWVCTMVSKDKSMEAMIQNDEDKEWLQPLLDIRNELDVQDDRDKRDFRRLHGNVQLFERNVKGQISVEPIPGPYTKKWREYWLTKVLEAQAQIRKTAPVEFQDIVLITMEELSEIRRIWLEEKHEFDDTLPRIYEQTMGQKFKDPRMVIEDKILGQEEWSVLEEICDNEMHLELMTKLLDTERQFFTRLRRNGIFQSLEKCFETSGYSKEEAIKNAHTRRNLKIAVSEGNVQKIKEEVKQLSWANLKFSTPNDSEE